MTDWQGDLDDDCTLERYGMFAHAEKMDRGWWWVAVYRSREDRGEALYSSSEAKTYTKLRTGGEARAAAQAVMEVLRAMP